LNALEKTRQVLAHTRNRAVLPLLAAALRSSCAEVRSSAIRATVQRLDLESHSQLIRHFAAFSEAEIAILAEAYQAMPHHATPALKAAVTGSNKSLSESACKVIVACHHFDSMPALLKALEYPQHPNAGELAATSLRLAQELHERLVQWTADGERSGHDPTFARHQMLVAIERYFDRVRENARWETIEAFVLLAPSDHATLARILNDPQHACHTHLVAILSSNDSPPIVERLVGFMRDTDAPQAALETVARRTDRPFVEFLLQRLKHPVPLRTLHNMQRLRSVAWLESHREMLLDFDGRAQAIAVELAAAASLERESLFAFLMLLLRDGLAEGRRAACQALAKFDGPSADMLILAALEDPDASVQAAAARQLRPRRVPEALKVLVSFLDSPALEVREAARSSLAEFNFIRYRAMFDLLDESAAKTTGQLVHKVDDAAINGLMEELTSPSVSSRLRGIDMAVAMHAAQDVCGQLVELARHENQSIRQEALAALAECSGPQVLDVLESAAKDNNQSVAEAAQKSLAHYRHRGSGDPSLAATH
jgi:HEAT repeat protein